MQFRIQEDEHAQGKDYAFFRLWFSKLVVISSANTSKTIRQAIFYRMRERPLFAINQNKFYTKNLEVEFY